MSEKKSTTPASPEKDSKITAIENDLIQKAESLESFGQDIAYLTQSDELTKEERLTEIDQRIRQAIGLLQTMKDQAYAGLRLVRS